MRSNSSTSAHARSFGSVRHSPPLSPSLAQTLSLLDEAAEQLMVHREFQAAFDTCERGLASLASVEQEDTRYGEFKAGLCILGIQALAELNLWRGVLVWILQHYECPEKIPAKIMQMCILLYTKVSEQAVMQEAAKLWLHCPSNSRLAGFGTVAELYLLHVLVPLGLVEEARELVVGEVGSGAFTEDQRQTALEFVDEKERESQELPPNPSRSPSPENTGHSVSPQGAVIQKLQGMLRLLYRGLSVASAGSFPLRRVFMAIVILYMLFVRLDPGMSMMRGLMNYGVTCCVNALLQSFSATWELVDLLDKWIPAGVERDRREDVPLQLRSTLQAMQCDQPSPAPHRDFLRCLDNNHISLNVQHDANEVFLAILNFLQQQMDDKTQALDIQNLYKMSLETHLVCSECTDSQAVSSYVLSLPLHLREGDNSLEDCLLSFFQPQELKDSDRYYCERCGEKTPFKKRFRLVSLPPVLCIHLKRFRSSQSYTRKLDCKVTFPETFDFAEVLKEDSFTGNSVEEGSRYTLYAVIVHSGTAMFGHYTAYVRHRSDHSWYYTNDSHVQKASWEKVQTTYGGESYGGTAYMLLYRRNAGGGEEPQRSDGADEDPGSQR